MLLQSTIEQIAEAQKLNLKQKDRGFTREVLKFLPNLSGHALIISGIRRCGKSTLLYQMLQKSYKGAFYFNFEDPRLYEFEKADFLRLDKVIVSEKTNTLMFDEIQIIEDWERFVRQKLEDGFKVVITGSNASLLSKELGTKLTGRHITKDLFPFSYREFCQFTQRPPSETSLSSYLDIGGFPEYIKTGEADILSQLFDDILIRDIAVRYGIRDIRSLQQLAIYLISNVGRLITGNKLKGMLGISATSTVMEYLSHLENAWLFHFVPKFSYSYKKQIINPRKVFAIDTGLVNHTSTSFSEDKGHLFENLIYLHLRRNYKDIFYFSEKGECDFVIHDKNKPTQAIQVCYDLNQDTLDRELNGVFEAMAYFDLGEGLIVTPNQQDEFRRDGKVVKVVEAWEFMG